MLGSLPGIQIINPWLDTLSLRKQRLAIIIPVIGVIFVILGISLVSWRNYTVTRNGAVQLSNQLLHAQQEYIVKEVEDYLIPATAGSPLAATMIARGNSLDDESHSFMLFTRSLLTHSVQSQSAYLADEDGHFWINVKKGDQFVETTITPNSDKKDQNEDHKTVDKDGNLVSRETSTAIANDVRQTWWYQGAFKTEARHPGELPIHWTSPYWDPETSQYILTASYPFETVTGKKMVFALNISLKKITDFINSLKVGKTGQAVIVDVHGRVIAGHNMLSLGQPGFDPTNVFLNPVIQPAFTRALNVFKVKGANSAVERINGQDYVSISSGIPLAKRNWILMLTAPEKDFSGFADTAHKQTLIFSIAVIILAGVLASGLIWQGLRIRKLHTKIKDDEGESQEEAASLASISQLQGIFDPNQDISEFSEAIAYRSKASQVGLWRLGPDNTLSCDDLFDSVRKVHSAGAHLTPTLNPTVFNVLKTGHSAHLDLRGKTQDYLKTIYQYPLNHRNAVDLYLYPILNKGKPVGLLSIENPQDIDAGALVVAFITSILTLRFTGSAQKVLKSSKTISVSASYKAKQNQGFLLTPEGTGKIAKGSMPTPGLYPKIPLMVLEFTSDFSSDAAIAKENLLAIQKLSIKIQNICSQTGVYSLQVSGSRAIFLGECKLETQPGDVQKLAEAALLIREECLSLLANLQTNVSFSMGIDVGPALVASLGQDPKVFNLWGRVFSTACLLTGSSPDTGTIQVSEDVYHQLKDTFLFRSRGEFYLPGIGTSACYILAGRS